jgi:hypothetical protein
MEVFGKVLLGVAVNYSVHYISMAAHNWMCMPHSFVEVAKGLVVAASPVCSTLLSVGQTTQNSYATLITSVVATVVLNGVNRATQTTTRSPPPQAEQEHAGPPAEC